MIWDLLTAKDKTYFREFTNVRWRRLSNQFKLALVVAFLSGVAVGVFVFGAVYEQALK